MRFIVIILLIHYILWLQFLIGRVRHKISYYYIDLLISFMIPVFGHLYFFIKKYSDVDSERNAEVSEVEPLTEFHHKTDSFGNEELYDENEIMNTGVTKSIVMDEDDVREKVVPLGEAMVVNNAATRRELIIDVLYSDPEEYVSQLFDAKQSGDTEVVHYAATALTEIQKKFDLEFQDIMKRKKDTPEDEKLDVEYRKLLERYILSGLLEGDGLKNQLKKYSELLKKELSKDSVRGKWALINKKTDADIKLHDQNALDEDIMYMNERWPEREGTYLAMMKSAILRKDRDELDLIIGEIKEKGIYLSSEVKSTLKFWNMDDRGF